MAGEEQDTGWVKDLSHETFQACLAFYDKNPTIGAIGFLLVLSSLPLWIILRFITNMRRVDNEVVVEKLRLELDSKAKKRKKKSSNSASAATTTTIAGG